MLTAHRPSRPRRPPGDEALATLQYAAAQPQVDGPGLAQHLVTFFKAYTGRLNHTAQHLVDRWEAGERYPAAAADDSQANAIVKVTARRRPGGGGWVGGGGGLRGVGLPLRFGMRPWQRLDPSSTSTHVVCPPAQPKH
jgi:hypothetical protein